MTEYETESQLTCLFMKHILILKKCTWNKKKSHATAYKPETAATVIIKKMCEEIKSLIIVGSGFFLGGGFGLTFKFMWNCIFVFFKTVWLTLMKNIVCITSLTNKSMN